MSHALVHVSSSPAGSHEVLVSWQGATESIAVEASATLGRLKSKVASRFKLANCSLVGVDLDEIPLRHLNLAASGPALLVSDAESNQREFAVAQIQLLDGADLAT